MGKDEMTKIWMEMVQARERGKKRLTLLDFVKTVKRNVPNISYECCIEKAREPFSREHEGYPFCPIPFSSFCSAFCRGVKPQKILVPFADGTEISFLREIETKVDYKFWSQELEAVAQEFYTFNAVQTPENNYDLIIADLPLGPINSQFISCKIVEDCIDRIVENGYCIFTFTRGLTTSTGKQWIENLGRKGLFCNAVMDMPVGSYRPMTNVDTVVAVFSKRKTDKLFVALLEDENIIEKVVANFLNMKSSAADPKFGEYVDDDIFCYSKLVEIKAIHQLIASVKERYNGECICISEFGEISSCSDENEQKDCSVYVPRIAHLPVVLQMDDVPVKMNNYYQIVVDETRMTPRFLAFFLNSEEGKKIRQLHSEGTGVPIISISALGQVMVPCPPKETQRVYLETFSRIESLRVEVETIRDKFVKTPASYNNIQEEIKNINNQGDRFLQWIESLPYPIATILKRYSVLDDASKQQETLFYFFEAYAIFESTILCAGINKRIVDNLALSELDPAYFEKASFGNWAFLDRELSKTYRDMLNDKDAEIRKIPFACFHTSDEYLISRLCSRAVCSVLDDACQKRNHWKGHGGVTSEASYVEHVGYLTDLLRKVQENIKDLYERIRLVRLVEMEYFDERFINRVEVLTGSNEYFRKETLVTLKPMEKRKLYLHIVDSNETLELPPYFILKNSPTEVKNACYFYSRIEGKNTKYVSYHYEGRPEDIENGSEAFETIKKLLSH